MPKDKNKLDHGISPHNVSSSQPKNIEIFYKNYERNLRVQTKIYSYKEKQAQELSI